MSKHGNMADTILIKRPEFGATIMDKTDTICYPLLCNEKTIAFVLSQPKVYNMGLNHEETLSKTK